MIIKETFLWIIIIITFLRTVFNRFRGNFDTQYLLVSLFVIAAPFNFEWPIEKLITGKAFQTYDLDYLSTTRALPGFGTFGSAVSINAAFLISVLLILCGYYKLKKDTFTLKKDLWLYVLLVFCVITYFNPYNLIPVSIFPVVAYIVQFVFLFKLLESNFTRETIFKGAFDGLAVLTLCNLFLTICFPIFKLDWAATFIYGKIALINASRKGGYPGAVGIFVHPLPLAIFTLIPISFFLSCYFKKYTNKILLIFYLAANLFVCFFTFSRTGYLSIGISIALLIFLYYKKSELTIKPKAVVLSVLLLVVVGGAFFYLTEFANLRLLKDASQQANFREVHWQLAYEIWKTNPVLGTGLNTNVYYLQHTNLSYTGLANGVSVFFAIHSLHLTMLAETGILGIIAWVYFLFSQIKGSFSFIGERSKTDDIYSMTFLSIMVGGILIYQSFNPMSYSVLSLILFFGYFALPNIPVVKKIQTRRRRSTV
jgi:O-antigen ligase